MQMKYLKNYNIKWKLLIISVLLILLIVLLTNCISSIPEKYKEIDVKLEQPEFFLSDNPIDSLVYQACLYYNISNPELVVAQSILETGYYRSEVCKKNNNLFGLYNSHEKEYFKFSHWTESVKAYKNMIQNRYKDGEDYHEFLDRIGYAEDSLYNNKLKKIIKRYGLSEIYK